MTVSQNNSLNLQTVRNGKFTESTGGRFMEIVLL
jgi:hypothetical protein